MCFRFSKCGKILFVVTCFAVKIDVRKYAMYDTDSLVFRLVFWSGI